MTTFAPRRSLVPLASLVSLTVAASTLFLAGCGGGDSSSAAAPTEGTGGASGSAGSGGATSTGGASAAGGSSGHAGSAGHAGTAGSSGHAGGSGGAGHSGAAGSSGSAGSAGKGGAGIAGGAGGAGGSSAGKGGEAGAGGGAGKGGAAGANATCNSDPDCDASAPTTNPPGCAKGVCDTSKHTCSYAAKDEDGDGHAAAMCTATDGTTIVLGDDCDDTDSNTYPGAWDGPKGDGHADRCDGLDENCDGIPDDDKLMSGASCVCAPGDVAACSEDASGKAIMWPTPAPMGSCKYGSKTCGSDGAFGPCIGAVAPAPADVCTVEGDDSNCNGKANDTCTCVDVPADPTYSKSCATDAAGNPITYPGGVPKGTCKYGTSTCTGSGQYGACMGAIGPAAMDGCDPGNDDDCDGIPNEGCGCQDGQTQTCGSTVGTCKQGTQLCTGGVWGVCAGGVGAAAEVCNGLDDDCDGIVDDNIPANGSCSGGLGACLQPGQIVCNAMTGAMFMCNAVPGAPDFTPSTTPWTDGLGNLTWDGNCNGIVKGDAPTGNVLYGGTNCSNTMALNAFCAQGTMANCTSLTTVVVCAGSAGTPEECGANTGTIKCVESLGNGCQFSGLKSPTTISCD